MNSLTQTQTKLQGEWYSQLIEECKAIVTEAIYNSRWALVEGYWNLGKRIREEKLLLKGEYGKAHNILQDLAKSIGVSTRTIHYALQAYDKYPDINKIPEGKNISWNKLITKYLPKPKKSDPIPLPKGKYQIIYADPPWDIGSFVLEKWESPLEDKYPTMKEDELMQLDIQGLSAENCVLFLWTTLSTLPKALRLIEHWGFKYHITITWDKIGGWSSNGFHRRTELCLVGYKGILSKVIKQEGEYIPTIFQESKRKHSQKPIKMYEYIENRTIGRKIELFARNKRDGWDSWGNEI